MGNTEPAGRTGWASSVCGSISASFRGMRGAAAGTMWGACRSQYVCAMSSAGTHRWPRWADSAIAGVVVAVGVVELVLVPGDVPAGQFTVAVVMGAALAWRRHAPVTVLLIMMAALTAQQVASFEVNYLYTPLTLYTAYYSMGAHRPLHPAAAGLGLALA